MKTAKNYTAPECETHGLQQLQVICASDWRQNGASTLGYDYNYDEEWDELY